MQVTHRHRNRRANRKGLTLIELLVVLVILVALAGILIPILPNVVQQSHGAAGADNIKEVAKAIQLHQATTGLFPNDWDSLIDANGETVAQEHLVSTDVTTQPEVLAALDSAGITSSFQHLDLTDGSINKTFAGVDYGTPEFTGTTGNVAFLNADAENELGLVPSGTTVQAYVAFGLGARSTAIGQSIVDAPIHFPEAGETPAEVYSRFVVVFAVPAGGGPLRVATVAGIHDMDELSGLREHMEEYFGATQ